MANKKPEKCNDKARSSQPTRRNLLQGAAASGATLLLGRPAIAQSKKEIIIGNIDAYSGPAASIRRSAARPAPTSR